jgi:hypothetical protein
VVVNTQNRGGSSLRKRFSVQTNDPIKSRVDLTVVGKVQGFMKVSPLYVRLIGTQGKEIQQIVRITPEPSYPFTITEVTVKDGKDIEYQLEPLGKDPKKDGYKLLVRNTRTEKGAYRDYITIKTDFSKKPSIRIPVTGRILQAKEKTKNKK